MRRSVATKYPSDPDSFDPSSSARNIGGWRPDPGERPPLFPEEYWRSLALGGDTQLPPDGQTDPQVARKQLLWACKNRGWAEMSQLLSAFVDSTNRLTELSDEEIKDLGRILKGKETLECLPDTVACV